MKCNRVFLLLILISTNCFSQRTGEAHIADVTKVTFFNPGVSYEKRIGKLQSLYAQAFLNTSFAPGFSDALGTTFKVAIDPVSLYNTGIIIIQLTTVSQLSLRLWLNKRK